MIYKSVDRAWPAELFDVWQRRHKSTLCANIPVHIVDYHNEVLRYWDLDKPVVVLHIDHHDDFMGAYPWAKQKGITRQGYFDSRSSGSFLSSAVRYLDVVAVYHLSPRDEYVSILPEEETNDEFLCPPYSSYGRVSEKGIVERLETIIKGGLIKRKNKYHLLNLQEFQNELLQMPFTLILDIDLDAFWGVTSNINMQAYHAHFKIVEDVLRNVKQPELITIARSQENKEWIHPKVVDMAQLDCLNMLAGVYDNGT